MSRRNKAGATAVLRGGAPIFAALGHETRLGIVSRLCTDGPTSIVQLTAGSGVTRQAVTKHLRILEDAGLVRDRGEGRESSWELQPDRLEAARRSLDQISQQWGAALKRLDEYVGGQEG